MPPLKVKVVEFPVQTDVTPVTLVGATEVELTVTVVETHEVVLQDELYRTK